MKYYTLTGTWKEDVGPDRDSLPTSIKIGIGETQQERSIHTDPASYDVWSILDHVPSPGEDLGDFVVTTVTELPVAETTPAPAPATVAPATPAPAPAATGTTFNGQFMVIERDDAVLIPGPPQSPDFQSVQVTLDPGITTEMIDSDQAALLQSEDGSKLRFIPFDAETWGDNVDKWTSEGWMPVGPGACRFYNTFQEYLASEMD